MQLSARWARGRSTSWMSDVASSLVRKELRDVEPEPRKRRRREASIHLDRAAAIETLLDQQEELRAFTESSSHNTLDLNPDVHELGVITTGIARNYYLEHLRDLPYRLSHLHIGVYPIPVEKVRTLIERSQE